MASPSAEGPKPARGSLGLRLLSPPRACPTAPSLYLLWHPLCLPAASLLHRGTIGSPKECAPEALTLVPTWTKGQ